MPALALPILAVITDRTLLAPNWTLAQAVAPAVTGGANLVIVAETDLPEAPRLTVARFVRDGVRGRVPFLLAGDPGLARKAGADGVCVAEEPENVAAARSVLGPAIIGVTVTSPDRVRRAGVEGADFALVELDWSDSEVALDAVRALASAAVDLPLVVGTDVPLEHVEACVQAGAAGVAVCRPAMSAYNRTRTLAQYAAALRGTGSQPGT